MTPTKVCLEDKEGRKVKEQVNCQASSRLQENGRGNFHFMQSTFPSALSVSLPYPLRSAVPRETMVPSDPSHPCRCEGEADWRLRSQVQGISTGISTVLPLALEQTQGEGCHEYEADSHQ